ncbi:hypothetical protein ZWY2020_038671 [Hordeum vulgare]|nr:hypothetical protein ZWY2020_038671 [Hordeum vulgare]
MDACKARRIIPARDRSTHRDMTRAGHASGRQESRAATPPPSNPRNRWHQRTGRTSVYVRAAPAIDAHARARAIRARTAEEELAERVPAIDAPLTPPLSLLPVGDRHGLSGPRQVAKQQLSSGSCRPPALPRPARCFSPSPEVNGMKQQPD